MSLAWSPLLDELGSEGFVLFSGKFGDYIGDWDRDSRDWTLVNLNMEDGDSGNHRKITVQRFSILVFLLISSHIKYIWYLLSS